MVSHTKKKILLQDVAIIVMSILIAILLVETKALSSILLSTSQLQIVGSFIAGMFFTSVFTTAPAIVTLGEIAHVNSVLVTAFVGALGALVGDLIIFRFIRDKLSEHLVELVQHDSIWKRLKALFRLRYFRWLTFLAGGLIIASPLPDELGISLLGFSKMKISQFIPISLFFNFVGILVIGLIARTI